MTPRTSVAHLNLAEQKQCFFCVSNSDAIDYKDSETLRRFMSVQGKIYPRKKSHLCARHQRRLANAIKRARFLAILPYTTQ